MRKTIKDIFKFNKLNSRISNCFTNRHPVSASLLCQISTRYLKPFMNYSGLKIRKSDHSEYSDTNGPKRAVGVLHFYTCSERIARTIFFFTNSCEPELAHRLQTSKMRRNSTSLDSCQHDDINIVTVSVARRR